MVYFAPQQFRAAQFCGSFSFASNGPISSGNEDSNADADLTIVADRTGVEWQEGVLIHVLRESVACSRMSFHKARLVLEDCS